MAKLGTCRLAVVVLAVGLAGCSAEIGTDLVPTQEPTTSHGLRVPVGDRGIIISPGADADVLSLLNDLQSAIENALVFFEPPSGLTTVGEYRALAYITHHIL